MLCAMSAEWCEQLSTSTSCASSVQTIIIIIIICITTQFPQRRQSDGQLDHERDHGSRTSCRLWRHRSVLFSAGDVLFSVVCVCNFVTLQHYNGRRLQISSWNSSGRTVRLNSLDKQHSAMGNAGLWLRHSRQMPRAYDVEGAYERWLQNMLNRR